MTKRITEIRCGSILYFGSGAIERLETIMRGYRDEGVKRIGIVTGKSSYQKSGAWDAVSAVLSTLGFDYIHYDGIRPNPTVDQIDEAVGSFKGFDPETILGIGGGSPLDSSKLIALLLRNPHLSARDLYRGKPIKKRPLPVIAINLTHGTGSEVDRYAVATIPEEKKKAGYAMDFLYPEYSIDDPGLMLSLPKKEILYTSLDAFNHLIEAATTTLSSPYTLLLAKEGIALIKRWLPEAIHSPEAVEPRYWLLYASVLGGIAIDCSVVHITHPLEHTLSAFNPGLPHGLGLTLILPAVIEVIYPHVAETLSELLRPVVSGLRGRPDEAVTAAEGIREWIKELGIKENLSTYGFKVDDIPELTKNVFESQREGGSLTLVPFPVTEETISQIYKKALG